MGSGIAQVAAQAGLTTIVRELTNPLCERSRGAIAKSLDNAIEKGKLTADARTAALEQLTFTTRLDDLATCDIIIEDMRRKGAKLELADGK